METSGMIAAATALGVGAVSGFGASFTGRSTANKMDEQDARVANLIAVVTDMREQLRQVSFAQPRDDIRSLVTRIATLEGQVASLRAEVDYAQGPVYEDEPAPRRKTYREEPRQRKGQTYRDETYTDEYADEPPAPRTQSVPRAKASQARSPERPRKVLPEPRVAKTATAARRRAPPAAKKTAFRREKPEPEYIPDDATDYGDDDDEDVAALINSMR